MKAKKPKKGFMDGYKTYNPDQEGYGSPNEWRENFTQRMGLEQAREVMGTNDPLSVLELTGNPSWEEIKTAYRKQAMRWHPDRNPGNPEALANFKKVQAAYEILEERYK